MLMERVLPSAPRDIISAKIVPYIIWLALRNTTMAEQSNAFLAKESVPLVGVVFGAVALLFLMGLVVAALFGHQVPRESRFLVVAILGLALAFSVSFIGGNAVARGKLPLPFARSHPFEFTVTGGIAAFVIVIALGFYFYVRIDDGMTGSGGGVASWPGKFAELKSAELQISEIDDEMIVKVNNTLVARGVYGETASWVPIKEFLKRGSNSIEIQIFNGSYGGCGGRLTLKFNGVTDPQYSWTWFKELGAFPNSVCFSQFKTVNLE
jgi:hypothetical protein